MGAVTLAQVRKMVPGIHVSRGRETTILRPQPTDVQYEARQYSDNFTEGRGTKKRPFTYLSAAPVSAHYAVIDLWLKFRSRANKKMRVFIEVNDWILQVESSGVRAEDGQFTRFIYND